jgi:hypothetical protein
LSLARDDLDQEYLFRYDHKRFSILVTPSEFHIIAKNLLNGLSPKRGHVIIPLSDILAISHAEITGSYFAKQVILVKAVLETFVFVLELDARQSLSGEALFTEIQTILDAVQEKSAPTRDSTPIFPKINWPRDQYSATGLIIGGIALLLLGLLSGLSFGFWGLVLILAGWWLHRHITHVKAQVETILFEVY